MSILIEGMEMPTEGGTICVYKISGKFFAARAGKDELFPIVPILEPHGRLIDADEFFEALTMDDRVSIVEAMHVQSILSDASTIIPASKEG